MCGSQVSSIWMDVSAVVGVWMAPPPRSPFLLFSDAQKNVLDKRPSCDFVDSRQVILFM